MAVFLTKKHLSRRTFLRGSGGEGGAAFPGRDGSGSHRAGANSGRT